MILYALIFLCIMLVLLKLAGFIFWFWWVVMIPGLTAFCIFAILYIVAKNEIKSLMK